MSSWMQKDGLGCLSCYNFASHRRIHDTSRIISVGFRNLTTVTLITLLYRQMQKNSNMTHSHPTHEYLTYWLNCSRMMLHKYKLRFSSTFHKLYYEFDDLLPVSYYCLPLLTKIIMWIIYWNIGRDLPIMSTYFWTCTLKSDQQSNLHIYNDRRKLNTLQKLHNTQRIME